MAQTFPKRHGPALRRFNEGLPQEVYLRLRWGELDIFLSDRKTEISHLKLRGCEVTRLGGANVRVVAGSWKMLFTFPTPTEANTWQNDLMVSSHWQLKHFYTPDYQIGAGGFGTVILAESVSTKEKVAIKIMKNVPQQRIRRSLELEIMESVQGDPYLMGARDILVSQTKTYVVMDLMHTNLEDYMIMGDPARRDEKLVKSVMYCTLLGLKSLHERRIIHRDLKANNVLLTVDPNGNVNVRICDFGLSKVLQPGVHHHPYRVLYTLTMYAAPELHNREPYSTATDMFALGAVLYELLTGETAFGEKADPITLQNIRLGKVRQCDAWCNASPMARDLVMGMLAHKDRRCNAIQALNHAWFADLPKPTPDNKPTGEESRQGG